MNNKIKKRVIEGDSLNYNTFTGTTQRQYSTEQ
jgi:hypothetical protein